jgi:hypothetical protein
MTETEKLPTQMSTTKKHIGCDALMNLDGIELHYDDKFDLRYSHFSDLGRSIRIGILSQAAVIKTALMVQWL